VARDICRRVCLNRRNTDIWYKQLKWGDLLIYLIVVAVSVAMLVAAPGMLTDASVANKPLEAKIIVDNKVIHTIPESELIVGGFWDFEAHGYHYHISYEDGKVRFEEADCPDQVCVRTGWLSSDGQISACVPGHVLLKIEGRLGGTDADSSATYDEPDVVIQ
jgi:hypothetical protein